MRYNGYMDPQIAKLLTENPKLAALSLQMMQLMQTADQAQIMAALQTGDAAAISAAMGTTPEELQRITGEFQTISQQLVLEHPELAEQLGALQFPGMPIPPR